MMMPQSKQEAKLPRW